MDKAFLAAFTCLMPFLSLFVSVPMVNAEPGVVKINALYRHEPYLPGVPAGDWVWVTVDIESPYAWDNTVDGIVGWDFDVHVDPTVLEPWGAYASSFGYFLYDFVDWNMYVGHYPALLVAEVNKTTGDIRDIAEFIMGYGFDPGQLDVGAGGNSTDPWWYGGEGTGGYGLCRLRFKSKSQTASTKIDISDAAYWTMDPVTGMGVRHPIPEEDITDAYYTSAPDAEFTYSPSMPLVNDTVTFNASASHDPDGYIVSYDWDFGDGNITTATDPVIDHVYTETGIYTVTLNVTDNDGLSGTAMAYVSVLAPVVHDIAVTSVAASPTVVARGQAVNVTVIVENQGSFAEAFDVTAYYEANAIGMETVTLDPNTARSLTFIWSTAGVVQGTYEISAEASVVPDETETDDNTYINGTVTIVTPEVALISEHSELSSITGILDLMRISYDTYNDNTIHLYTEDLGLLIEYQAVILYTDYRSTTSREHSALESYLSSGGNLLATGFDCLISDSLLADLIRSSSMGDNVGEPDLYVVDATHPIMNGPYGTFPVGYHISGLYGDCDAAEADTARMAVTVAELADGYDKIVATESIPGKVVFWNGRGDLDWTGNADCEVMFKNTIAWFTFRYEHELIVSLETPDFLEPGDSSLLNATLSNHGLSTEMNVDLFLLVNGTVADNVTIPELVNGTAYTLSYLWTPTVEGIYNLTAYAAPVPGENITTNNFATKIVTVRPVKYVLWDDVHDGDGDSLTGNYLSLYQLLSSSGFVVHELTSGTIDSEALAPYDILVLIDPEYDFLLSEITDIHDWVETDGALIVIPNTGYPSTLNTIMAPYGVQLTGLGAGWGTTTNVVAHPITQNVGSIYYDLAWELATVPPSEALAWTFEYYAFISATAGGEVAVISDSNLMDNYGLGMADNTQLMLNIFNWIGVQYEHELAVTLETPDFLEPGDSSLLNATLSNHGLSTEMNVDLFLLVNGTVADNVTIPELVNGTAYTLSYLWTPTVEAPYNVTAYAVPVPGEIVTANNIATKMVLVRSIKGYILVDQTHGTDSITGYRTWIDDLIRRGYVVDTHTAGPITSTVLATYDVFVTPQAHSTYSPDELTAIQSFVSNGGGLLVIGDDDPYIYTDLTDFAGISWTYGGVSGITTDITAHEVTVGVSSVYLQAPVAMMHVSGVAMDLVRDPAGNVMLAACEHVGKVIGFADEGSLWNYGIVEEDNLRLANNMIDWLSLARPVTSFTYEPVAPYVGDTVAFNASASYDPDGTIISYEWDFGDGFSHIGMVATHAYWEEGTFTVNLTVTDDDGLTDTAIANVTVRHRVLMIKLSGEHDYLFMERVKIRVAALVTHTETMEPVSGANVTIDIYDPEGNLWISDNMTERLPGRGIYEWESTGTILQLMSARQLHKGVYLAQVQASHREGPIATDILEFHIDPPLEEPIQLHTVLLFVMVGALVTVISGWYLDRRRLARKHH